MDIVNNSSALASLWSNSDAIIKTVAVILILMSIAKWSIFLSKALDLHKLQQVGQRVDGFWKAPDIDSGLHHLGVNANKPFYALALESQETTQHLIKANTLQLHKAMDLSNWVERALNKSLYDHRVGAQRSIGLGTGSLYRTLHWLVWCGVGSITP